MDQNAKTRKNLYLSRAFISILTNQDKSCVTILCPIISLVTLKFLQELIAFFRKTGYLLQVESIKKSTVISSLLFITNTLCIVGVH